MIIWTSGPFGGGRIAARTGPRAAPDTDGPLRARLRRALVGVRHVRLD
ncbi:hypothetical protein ACIPJK_10400 [Streptomyces roseus]